MSDSTDALINTAGALIVLGAASQIFNRRKTKRKKRRVTW